MIHHLVVCGSAPKYGPEVVPEDHAPLACDLALFPRPRGPVSGPYGLNDATNSPFFCARCSYVAVRQMADRPGPHVVTFWMPSECEACTGSRDPVALTKCRARFTTEQYKRICMTHGAHQTVAKRDSQLSVINLYDERGVEFNEGDAFLQAHLSTIFALQQQYCDVYPRGLWARIVKAICCEQLWPRPKRYALKGVGYTCRMCATQFELDTSSEDQALPPPAVTVVCIEDLVSEHGGMYPQVKYKSMDTSLVEHFKSLTSRDPPKAAATDVDIMESPPPYILASGGDYGVIYSEAARKVGPIVVPPLVFTNKDTLTTCVGAAARSVPDVRLNEKSDAYKSYCRAMIACSDNVFTERAIRSALGRCPPLEELVWKKLGARSTEEINKLLSADYVDVFRQYRQGMTKMEGVVKRDPKPPRVIQDEGFVLLCINARTAWVFEEVLFDAMREMSIKHRRRDEVLQSIAERFSRKRLQTVFEVDQTAFEYHETTNGEFGLLTPIFSIHRRIWNVAVKYSSEQAEMVTAYNARIAADSKGMSYQVRMVDGRTYTFNFQDFYLPSGWRFTSSVNYLVETVATYTAFTLNPEHLFAVNRGGELYLRKGHRHVYKLIDEQEGHLEAVFEGDDGLGQTDLSMLDQKSVIEGRYASLGLKTKLKFIVQGRAEFIGTHFRVVSGKTDPRSSWTPDIKRGMAKMGVYAGKARGAEFAPAVAARFLSLARAYAGKCSPLAASFLSLGKHWQAKSAIPDVTLDYALSQIFDGTEGSVVCLSTLLVTAESEVQRDVNLQAELPMVNISLERDGARAITPAIYSRWYDDAHVLTEYSRGEVFDYLAFGTVEAVPTGHERSQLKIPGAIPN